MENKNLKRGSVWRKWDLHIHPPFTKSNDQYIAENEDSKWNLFCEAIESSDVAVFGITDYFSVENYILFLQKFKSKYPNSEKIFFPNIEFRIDSKNKEDDHIQVHVIFSNQEKTLKKLNDFFTRLELVSTDNVNLTNKYCTESDLQEITFDKAMVKIDVLEKQLKSDFSNSEFLIVGVARGYGSLRPGIDDSRGNEYAKELDKKCKLFFGSSKDTDFFLNKVEGRTQYKLPSKSVIYGCDSHSFDDLEKKLGKTFEEKNNADEIIDCSETTWIKSDPTFEGLRQIVYEPKDRVKIQELKPEEKEEYQVIDKVSFIDDSFTPDDILINQNLTTIIGGKSTGKSILLRNIAQAIDPLEVSNRLQEVGLPEYKEQVSGFTVVWKDKQENKKNEENGVNKKIIYIPQSYLNRLVDKKEDKTSIDDIIKNILEQEDDVKTAFSTLKDSNRSIEKTLTQNIEDLFYKESDIKNLAEHIKKIGDKKGIESEIKKLKQEVAELKIKSGMSNEQISRYNELLKEITQLKTTQEVLEKDLKLLNILKTENLSVIASDSLFSLSIELKNILSTTLDEIKNKVDKEWLNKVEIEYKKVEKSKTTNQIELEKLHTEFKPLLEQAQKSKALDEKIKKLETEEKKLKEIAIEEKHFQGLKSDYDNLIKIISENHSKFFDSFFVARAKILEQRSITQDQDLEFGIDIIFENISFQNNCINDICDQRKLSQFEGGFLQEYSRSDNANFKDDIEKITKAILNQKLTLKTSYSRKEALTKVLQNWFSFDYRIKQNGDEISEMSPGKKSFVLLKLLIELDSSRCPILLDQPEDDLDNRSIYNDLVKFIKIKKKERQIIIATHNPNLVVGADSECVIVANQNGDKSKNKTYAFEYIQGALENTFNIPNEEKVLYKQGIQEHVCDILEGGKQAFQKREQKYNFNL
jgi:predicted ATPase